MKRKVWAVQRVVIVPAVLGLLLGLTACAPRSAEPSPDPPRKTQEAEQPEPTEQPDSTEQRATLLLASLARSNEVAIIDPSLADDQAVTARVEVGAAPWGVGAHESTGYAATAEGLAVIDLATQKRTLLVPYEHPANRIASGEYRPGGLGLAVSPDGSRVYVAVTPDGASNWLEVFDTKTSQFVGSVPVGLRPFDVVVAPDGAWAATIDHDSFTVTVVDAATLAPTQHEIAPFGTEGGLASWEKPHYGAVAPDGSILLPYQGQAVARVNPLTGEFTTLPSSANSHAHGTTLAGDLLLTVGTGSFGNATGVPNLSILNTVTGEERVVPLDPPHETVALWRDADGAEYAAVGGGNTRDEGWDGITLASLADLSKRAIPVSGYPQAVVSFSAP